MSRRAIIPQAEWDRALRAALKRLPVGSFKIVVENGHPAILPVASAETQRAADQADTDWDKALGMT
jgi:hypothetical protein